MSVYTVLAGLVWLLQDRLAFPAPRMTLPIPAPPSLGDTEAISLAMRDGTNLSGLYFPPALPGGSPPFPALLWFYGNGETIGTIWPVLRDFRIPGFALAVVDYPGYGASGGRAAEASLYEAADLMYATLVARPEVDAARVFVYGRSLGTAVATHVAVSHPVAGLVLESPFTNARDMARRHYAPFPRFLLRLRLDNLERIRRVRCPLLVVHGTHDRLVPLEMGRIVAAAAPGPTELLLIEGAGHNDTYGLGGRRYRDKVWQFLQAASQPRVG